MSQHDEKLKSPSAPRGANGEKVTAGISVNVHIPENVLREIVDVQVASLQAELDALYAQHGRTAGSSFMDGMKHQREGDTKLVWALANEAGIKITAPDNCHGLIWEQFHAGVMALKQRAESAELHLKTAVPVSQRRGEQLYRALREGKEVPEDLRGTGRGGEVQRLVERVQWWTKLAKDWQEFAEWGWTIIANAYGGDWEKAKADWREAAGRYRDEYHSKIGPRVTQEVEATAAPEVIPVAMDGAKLFATWDDGTQIYTRNGYYLVVVHGPFGFLIDGFKWQQDSRAGMDAVDIQKAREIAARLNLRKL